jgi:hypothetical protein
MAAFAQDINLKTVAVGSNSACLVKDLAHGVGG